jgi:chromosome segregation ATPase
MSTAEPPPDAEPASEPESHHHRGWMWLSIGLIVACLGLIGWGAAKSADLEHAQDQQATNAAAVTDAVGDVNETLGATSEQLDQANSDVADAQKTADQAQQDATSAQADAADAKDDQAAAEAQTKQAQADAKAAESKLDVAKSCAKAYASAIGTLFEGEDLSAQAEEVKGKLSSITDDCRAALGG